MVLKYWSALKCGRIKIFSSPVVTLEYTISSDVVILKNRSAILSSAENGRDFRISTTDHVQAIGTSQMTSRPRIKIQGKAKSLRSVCLNGGCLRGEKLENNQHLSCSSKFYCNRWYDGETWRILERLFEYSIVPQSFHESAKSDLKLVLEAGLKLRGHNASSHIARS